MHALRADWRAQGARGEASGTLEPSEIKRNCVSAHFSFSAPLGYCASNSAASRDRRGGGASAWGGISPTLHGAALGTPGAVLRAETFDGSRRRARSLLPPPLPADVRAPLGRPAAPRQRRAPRGACAGPQEQRASEGEARGARTAESRHAVASQCARRSRGAGSDALSLCRWSGLRGSRAGS